MNTYESESITYEAEQFYDEVRGLVVVFLFFAFFFAISHITLQYFLAKTECETKPNRVDRLVYQLVLGIGTFALTIGLTSYSILPFSIIVNEILHLFPNSYYIQWLDSQVVHDLALAANLGTKISCLVIPFAYFLTLAQGFVGSAHSLGPRLVEAVANLALVYILIFGIVWTSGTFVDALHQSLFDSPSSWLADIDFFHHHPVSFIQASIQSLSWLGVVHRVGFQSLMRALEVVQITMSLVGLLLLFVCAPMGLIGMGSTLITKCIGSLARISNANRSRVSSPSLSQDRLDELHFEALTWMDDMESALIRQSICYHRDDRDDFVTYCTNQLNALKVELIALQVEPNATDGIIKQLTQSLTYTIGVALLFGLIRLMQSFVLFNIIGLVWNILFGNSTIGSSFDWTVSLLTVGGVDDDDQWKSVPTVNKVGNEYALGVAPVSLFGYLGAVLQFSLIHFLFLISLWGFYSFPPIRMFRPRHHSTPLDAALLNISLILMLCAALPLQTNLLGLTSLTVPNLVKTHYIFTSRSPPAHPPPLSSECLISPIVWYWPPSRFATPDCLKNSDSSPHSSTSTWFNVFSFWQQQQQPDSTVIQRPSKLTDKDADYNESSIFKQFISRAFGHSSVSTSYGLGLVILIYNLGFLFTSVWIAGRRLKHAKLSLGLEVISTLRCFHRLDFAAMSVGGRLHRSGSEGRRVGAPDELQCELF